MRDGGARARRRPRVVVVYKKSAYTVYVRERRLARVEHLLARKDPTVSRLLASDHEHGRSVEEVRRALDRLGVSARHVTLPLSPTACAALEEPPDLVVTVGGDGTLLATSHFIGSATPVVAINSAPRSSIGYFCGIQKGEIEGGLVAALEGQLPVTRLSRMRVEHDHSVLSARVLNDILFCAANPAETSRYILVYDGVFEEQKSSGVWIGPAAGSTAAQRSAGGRVLPSTSRKLQYVVREPYCPAGESYRLPKGLVTPGTRLAILNKMREARIYIDGPYQEANVAMGTRLEMTLSDEPLSILGFPGRKKS